MVVEVTGQGGIPANARRKRTSPAIRPLYWAQHRLPSSLVLAFLVGASAAAGVTPPTGFTELDDGFDGVSFAAHACYDMVSAPPTSIAYSTPYSNVGWHRR